MAVMWLSSIVLNWPKFRSYTCYLMRILTLIFTSSIWHHCLQPLFWRISQNLESPLCLLPLWVKFSKIVILQRTLFLTFLDTRGKWKFNADQHVVSRITMVILLDRSLKIRMYYKTLVSYMNIYCILL